MCGEKGDIKITPCDKEGSTQSCKRGRREREESKRREREGVKGKWMRGKGKVRK